MSSSEWDGTAWEGTAASRAVARAAPAPASSSRPPASAPLSVPYLNARSALGLSAVWRCVTLIADTIADMPWQEWRGDPDDGGTQLPASRLVRRPLVGRTRRWWTWRVVATEALFNRCVLLKTGGRDSAGSPWSLLPVPPAIAQPLDPDPYGMLPATRYRIGSLEVDADRDLTLIDRSPFPAIGEYLNGILDIARRQFTAYLAADVALSRYWQAGGPPTSIVKSDQDLSDPDAERIAQRWVERRSLGADYPIVLGKGADAHPWGADPTTESSVEARREINADVARFFGVPTRIVNAPASDGETYANVENDATDLLRYTLRGYMGPLEDGVSENLPGDYLEGRRMTLDPSRYVQGQLTDRAAAWSQLVGAGIADVEEARVRGFNLPPRAATPATPAPASSSVSVPVVMAAATAGPNP